MGTKTKLLRSAAESRTLAESYDGPGPDDTEEDSCRGKSEATEQSPHSHNRPGPVLRISMPSKAGFVVAPQNTDTRLSVRDGACTDVREATSQRNARLRLASLLQAGSDPLGQGPRTATNIMTTRWLGGYRSRYEISNHGTSAVDTGSTPSIMRGPLLGRKATVGDHHTSGRRED